MNEVVDYFAPKPVTPVLAKKAPDQNPPKLVFESPPSFIVPFVNNHSEPSEIASVILKTSPYSTPDGDPEVKREETQKAEKNKGTDLDKENEKNIRDPQEDKNREKAIKRQEK